MPARSACASGSSASPITSAAHPARPVPAPPASPAPQRYPKPHASAPTSMNRHDASAATVRLVPKSFTFHGPPRFCCRPVTSMTSVSTATPTATTVRIVSTRSGLTRNVGRGPARVVPALAVPRLDLVGRVPTGHLHRRRGGGAHRALHRLAPGRVGLARPQRDVLLGHRPADTRRRRRIGRCERHRGERHHARGVGVGGDRGRRRPLGRRGWRRQCREQLTGHRIEHRMPAGGASASGGAGVGSAGPPWCRRAPQSMQNRCSGPTSAPQTSHCMPRA